MKQVGAGWATASCTARRPDPCHQTQPARQPLGAACPMLQQQREASHCSAVAGAAAALNQPSWAARTSILHTSWQVQQAGSRRSLSHTQSCTCLCMCECVYMHMHRHWSTCTYILQLKPGMGLKYTWAGLGAAGGVAAAAAAAAGFAGPPLAAAAGFMPARPHTPPSDAQCSGRHPCADQSPCCGMYIRQMGHCSQVRLQHTSKGCTGPPHCSGRGMCA